MEKIDKMKKVLNLKKILFHLFLGGILIYFLYTLTGNYTYIFKIDNEQYIFQVTGERNYGDETTPEDFFYNKKGQYTKPIKSCGKFLLAGYDENKEYFYGFEYDREMEYKNENESKKTDNPEYSKKQCAGYFVLDLKTGEYLTGLSQDGQNIILSDKGIKNDMLTVEQFLYKYGEEVRNYSGIEY